MLLAGCQAAQYSNSAALMRHPEFTNAAIHAPEFTRSALKVINALEAQLEARP